MKNWVKRFSLNWPGIILCVITLFVFPIHLIGDTKSIPENYVKQLLINIKNIKSNKLSTYIDKNENIYVLYYKSINILDIYDKHGLLINSYTWDNPNLGGNFKILVDENGNVLIYQPDTYGSKHVLLDKNGKLINTFITFYLSWNVGFQNGVVFSEDTGEIIYKILNNDILKQNIFFKDIDSRYDIKKMRSKEDPDFFRKPLLSVPKSLVDYYIDNVYAIDHNGNIYVRYATKPKHIADNSIGYDLQKFEICKFDKTYKLKAIIPSHFAFVNLDDENLYEIKIDFKNKYMKVYKWEVSN